MNEAAIISGYVKTRTLEVLRLNVAQELSCDIASNLELVTEVVPRDMAIRLIASLRLPSEIAQDARIVSEFPASLWDHIKKSLGFAYRKDVVRVSETLVYPDISVPHGADRVLIHYNDRLERNLPCCGT